MPGAQTSEAPYGSHQFADRTNLTGWFGKLVDLIGRDNLKALHEKYGPLPDFERPKMGYRQRIISLIRDNIKAGVTVSLVSIPLALSLAVSAGAVPNMGLASAIWGGLFAAALGGSQYNIAGPTASGAGILAVYSLRYGYEILPFIAILSGLMMLVALFLRLDKYVLLLPGAVMHGWTIGVAFTIAGNQLAAAFGINDLKRHEQFYLNIYEVLSHLGKTQVGPFFVFLIAVVFIVSMGFYRPKVPWTIIVALTGIFIGLLAEYNAWFFHMDTLNGKYHGLKFSLFKTPTFKSTFFTGEILTASFEIAFISILESLLSAKVADRITNTRFAQPLEVFGIACANVIAGIFNGIPVTAALARTALNINSGATNRMAAILNAISCGVISLLLIRVLGFLPLAIIAALLVNVAIRMVKIENLTHLWLYDATMFRIAIFTALVTIFMDPAQGIIYGAVVSIFLYGLKNAEAWSEITVGQDDKAIVTHSSIELDRQALQDTFERQFPPTVQEDDENALEMQNMDSARPGRQAAQPGQQGGQAAVGGIVALDSQLVDVDDYDSDDEDRQMMAEENRVFITAPKYRSADHLIVRFPGELSYLNADHHADRLLPLLNTGRFLLLHLKRTYYIDLDGLDFLTDVVQKVEKIGNQILISGVTSQILPKLETMDWFVRAREEDRIVPDYKNAVVKIRQLDREAQRRYEERTYQDMTMYELEESKRHAQYLENVERARLEKEKRLAMAEEEERTRLEKKAEEERAREASYQEELARRQAAMEAKRKADAEIFEKRLAEFEMKKQEREAQRLAYLAAAASSSFMGAPSITVPHHHDHHIPPTRTHSSLGLRLAETPVHEVSDHSSASSSSHTPVHVAHPSHSEDSHATVQPPTAPATHEAHSTETAPVAHVPVETPTQTSMDIVEEEPKSSVVIQAPVIEEETPKAEEIEIASEPVPLTSDVVEPISSDTQEPVESVETPLIETSEPEAPQQETFDSETQTAVSSEPEPADVTSPAETSEALVEQVDTASNASAEVEQIPDEPIQQVEPVSEPAVIEAEPQLSVDSEPEPVAHEPIETVVEETQTAEEVQIEEPLAQPSTPPPESEASSVASDGPSGLQLSPRFETPEPQAPLDMDDPFEASPVIPSADSAPHLTIPGFHGDHAEHEEPVASLEAEKAEETLEAPIASEPVSSVVEPQSTVEYVDPFAEFSVASETSSQPPSAFSTPAKAPVADVTSPVATVDYIDPFADFGADLSFTSATPTPAKPTTNPAPVSVPSTNTSVAVDDFDPFSDILGEAAPASGGDDDADEELLL
jgi:SulP family sulfate permease